MEEGDQSLIKWRPLFNVGGDQSLINGRPLFNKIAKKGDQSLMVVLRIFSLVFHIGFPSIFSPLRH